MIKAVEHENALQVKKAYDDNTSPNKTRMINNMIFMGELFLKGAMHNGLVYRHVHETLSKLEDKLNDDVTESLCKFITVCGNKMDICPGIVNNFMTRLNKIRNCTRAPRIKFLVMDVIDLKKKNWKLLAKK